MTIRKVRKRKMTPRKRAILTRIRSQSYRAALARLGGDIHKAMHLERARDRLYTEAERGKFAGMASNAEESGKEMAQRAYRRMGY
jgi:hypothetical protein